MDAGGGDGIMLADNVAFTAEHPAMVRQLPTDVERQETDLFSMAAAGRTDEQAASSELFVQESAFRVLRVSEHIDPQDLANVAVRTAHQHRSPRKSRP